ncbi:AmmeMemoRadiSam system protein A [Variovorax terrae]|uniref:AmmeMemoRadiSam system protein A n=1 Tax=Variovorax terrae TaxID=2923278 RepID=A0A9X1W0T6_9BURK|nr:AmmeMemoRadiSam system protein A [Variovorax terrae]MCJ0764018.1 AmmeMemoRadiSam system protein A [Variovorax terrae]
MTSAFPVDQALAQAAAGWKTGDKAAARQLVHRVLRVAPDHPGALNLAGCAAFDDGLAGVALALFEKAAAGAPGDTAIQGNLARSQFVLGRIEAARRRADYLACLAPPAGAASREFEEKLLKVRSAWTSGATFLEADPARLRALLDAGLPAADEALLRSRPPKALVVPPIADAAASRAAGPAYARLRSSARLPAWRIRRVVLLGSAAQPAAFRGVALAGPGACVSPLGAVPADTLAADVLAGLPFVAVRPEAYAGGHDLGMHLPLLQSVLGEFDLLPLLVGEAAPHEVAQVLDRLWDGAQTLIVVSAPLPPPRGAEGGRQAPEAVPLQALRQVAAARGLRCELSGPDGEGVVFRPLDAMEFIATDDHGTRTSEPLEPEITLEQGLALVQLARAGLHEATGAPREPSPGTKSFQSAGAAYVTLTQDGRPRGCAGSLRAIRPLAEDVRANVAAAAQNDARFTAVTAAEAPGLVVTVSVLGEPRLLHFANESHALWQLEPGRDGVILECLHEGRLHAGLLPPKAWEQLPSPRAFLARLKVQAGLPFDFWSPEVRLRVCRVQTFSEAD